MDKELLFKHRLKERDVELEDVGTIRVRALSREEYADIREEFVDDDDEMVDAKGFTDAIIAAATLDPAGMTAEDVRLWSKAASGGEMMKVQQAINELSGLDDAEGSKSVRPNRQERRAKVRARARKGSR